MDDTPKSSLSRTSSTSSLVAHADRDAYRRNYSDLLQVLPTEIGSEIYSKGWLLPGEYQTFTNKSGNTQEQNEIILQALMRQKEGTIVEFCQLLCQHQSTMHIADKLLKDYREVQGGSSNSSGLQGTRGSNLHLLRTHCEELRKENRDLQTRIHELQSELEVTVAKRNEALARLHEYTFSEKKFEASHKTEISKQIVVRKELEQQNGKYRRDLQSYAKVVQNLHFELDRLQKEYGDFTPMSSASGSLRSDSQLSVNAEGEWGLRATGSERPSYEGSAIYSGQYSRPTLRPTQSLMDLRERPTLHTSHDILPALAQISLDDVSVGEEEGLRTFTYSTPIQQLSGSTNPRPQPPNSVPSNPMAVPSQLPPQDLQLHGTQPANAQYYGSRRPRSNPPLPRGSKAPFHKLRGPITHEVTSSQSSFHPLAQQGKRQKGTRSHTTAMPTQPPLTHSQSMMDVRQEVTESRTTRSFRGRLTNFVNKLKPGHSKSRLPLASSIPPQQKQPGPAQKTPKDTRHSRVHVDQPAPPKDPESEDEYESAPSSPVMTPRVLTTPLHVPNPSRATAGHQQFQRPTSPLNQNGNFRYSQKQVPFKRVLSQLSSGKANKGVFEGRKPAPPASRAHDYYQSDEGDDTDIDGTII